ncbi:MAG: hypothetical protein FWB71_03345 [Defluviitaleaceae bacterium]|nr:hypothetical protein [Defluviitaleaceae bacterium]
MDGACEFSRVVKEHFGMYPFAEITDFAKLAFQNEFGAGHLIRDEQKALEYLKAEMDALEGDGAHLYEYIGNNQGRIYLAAICAGKISLERFGSIFLESAKYVRGSEAGFLQKIEILADLAKAGELPFAPEDFWEFVEKWKCAGRPLFRHSEAYRQHYRPAYRVVNWEFCLEMENNGF